MSETKVIQGTEISPYDGTAHAEINDQSSDETRVPVKRLTGSVAIKKALDNEIFATKGTISDQTRDALAVSSKD